jgi:hypothetical protein
VQSKEFRPGVSSFAVATSTSKVDVDAISLLACQCKTQQRILALTYYVGTRDIDREI